MSKVTVRVLLVGIVLVGLSGVASAQSFVYSHQFVNGVIYCPGDAQYDDWLSYRAGLPASGVSSITMSGSQDLTGISCSDPVAAQQIADAMRNSVTASVSCGGNTWWVLAGGCQTGCGVSDNDLTVEIDGGGCSCGASYSLRPAIGNENWGGIAGATCTAPTQTMTLVVVAAAFANEVPTSTPLGLVLLIVMLAASGIAVLWRR